MRKEHKHLLQPIITGKRKDLSREDAYKFGLIGVEKGHEYFTIQQCECGATQVQDRIEGTYKAIVYLS